MASSNTLPVQENKLGGGNHREEVRYGTSHDGRGESEVGEEKQCDRSVMVGLWTSPSIPKLQCYRFSFDNPLINKTLVADSDLRSSFDNPLTNKTLVADSATPMKPKLRKKLLQRQWCERKQQADQERLWLAPQVEM